MLPVMLLLLVTGCLKDDDLSQTIILMGPELDGVPIDSLPGFDTLMAFIADPSSMHNTVLELPKGNFPPDIQGEFVFQIQGDSAYASNDHILSLDSLCFRFGGEPSFMQVSHDDTIHVGQLLIQGADTLVMAHDTVLHVVDTFVYYVNGQQNMAVPCEIYGDVMEKGNTYKIKGPAEGYVMGRGDDFVAYFVVEYDCEQLEIEFDLKRGYVVTGKINKDTKNISEAWVACVNIDSSIPSMAQRIYVYRILSVKKSYWTKMVS